MEVEPLEGQEDGKLEGVGQRTGQFSVLVVAVGAADLTRRTVIRMALTNEGAAMIVRRT